MIFRTTQESNSQLRDQSKIIYVSLSNEAQFKFPSKLL